MIAAIYARKSTEQSGVADEAKSVTRQIEHARAYAVSKGWTTVEERVYVDDGISGAEFASRPGFVRLMTATAQKPRPAFQVLVMSEESRLGREAIETSYALKQLITADVRVFFYLEDRERTLNSPMEKAMLALQSMSDEMEREKARQRTYDVLARKARAGQVTGGRTFGYDNITILGPGGERSHVERRINDAEAAVIVRIFEMMRDGMGKVSIAKRLNADKAVCPRPQRGRPASWSPSTVHEALNRELYRGVIVWNQTRKRNAWGQKRPQARAAGEVMRSRSHSFKSFLANCGPPCVTAWPMPARNIGVTTMAACGGVRATSRASICCPGSRAAGSAAAQSSSGRATTGSAGRRS
jgi:DNA invertase Pin-like site-specific DNA recombinase